MGTALPDILPPYCTREQVKAAADIASTSLNNPAIDRLSLSGSRSIDEMCLRRFYPWTGTRDFDWPDDIQGNSYRLWLNEWELVSLSTLVSGGITYGSTDLVLYPNGGPPYSRVEMELDGRSSFGGGSSWQNAVSVTGTYGYTDIKQACTVTTQSMLAGDTTVTVDDSGIWGVGVGDVITIGTERMIVLDKYYVDSGLTVSTTALTDSTADLIVNVAGAGTLRSTESILIGAEVMTVTNVLPGFVVVARAQDGSPLLPHAIGDHIYVPRQLKLSRGALGTTAAAHATDSIVSRQVWPALVNQLAIAEVLVALNTETAGYARTGTSPSTGTGATMSTIGDLRKRVCDAYGRAGTRLGTG
jgi:hypothetical protein